MAKRKSNSFQIVKGNKAALKKLAKQNYKIFINELNALKLRYCIMNIEKYMNYLKGKLRFPFNAFYMMDNGMFGIERTPIKVNKFFETHFKQGLKCVCILPANVSHNISFHLIELNEGHEFKELIDHYKNWHSLKP